MFRKKKLKGRKREDLELNVVVGEIRNNKDFRIIVQIPLRIRLVVTAVDARIYVSVQYWRMVSYLHEASSLLQ